MTSSELNNTFGALLLGTIFSSILYGATCLQSWHYFQHYTDLPIVKYGVAALLLLESLHSAFNIYAIYYYVILNYSNPLALLEATWAAVAVLFVTTTVTVIVHIFYTWRVYIVSKKNVPLVIFLLGLSLARFGIEMAVALLASMKPFVDFATIPRIYIPGYTVWSLATAIDILIAGSLSYYLHLGKTGFSKTDKIIDRLVVHAINNGILTTLIDILCLAFSIADKYTLIWLAIYQCVGNLYTNSMLSTLNTRISTRHPVPTLAELSGLSASDQPTSDQWITDTSSTDEMSTRERRDLDTQIIDINAQSPTRLWTEKKGSSAPEI